MALACGAALLLALGSNLSAAEGFSLESQIYIFKQGDFSRVDVSDAPAPAGGRSQCFKSPASVNFGDLTLSLGGGRIAWGAADSPPEQFGLVAAPNRVPIALGEPVSMLSSTTVQYLEPFAGNLQVREIPASSPDAPHIRLTFTADGIAGGRGDLLLTCDLDIATVSARKNIPGVALDIGRPVITAFREKLDIPASPGQWSAALLRSPNGSDYSMLMLLKLAEEEKPGSGGPNGGKAGANANESEAQVGPGGAGVPIADGEEVARASWWPSNHDMESVSVAAGADETYALRKFGGAGAKPRAETYVLAKGTFFGGFVRDKSLEDTQFAAIARVLAPNLAVNGYYPANDPKNADLFIVAHWGTTYGSSGAASYGGTGLGLSWWSPRNGYLWDERGTEWFRIIDSQLLGYDPERQEEYYRSMGVPLERTLETTMRRFDGWYRYFVILEAYDFRTVKGGAPGIRPRLVWSVHYSLPAFGNAFTEALPNMSRVAAKFFGRNIGGVLYRAQRIPEGVVKIGDPREIEDAQWK
jgi:hypothetical protein